MLVIQQKEHGVFQRRGCDLVIKKEITLLEALTGPAFVVEHLDGHKVRVAGGGEKAPLPSLTVEHPPPPPTPLPFPSLRLRCL